MKKRSLLAALALATTAAACGGDTPTTARAPERAAFDGGSLGAGHRSEGTEGTTVRNDTTLEGGSLGPGH